MAQWIEHWISTPAIPVQIPSGTWDFFKLCFSLSYERGGGSHMRPRTNFFLALHGECLHFNTYKNALIYFEKHF